MMRVFGVCVLKMRRVGMAQAQAGSNDLRSLLSFFFPLSLSSFLPPFLPPPLFFVFLFLCAPLSLEVGRAALEALPATFGADDEVEGAVKDFAENCARVWLAAARREEVSSEAQQTVSTPTTKGQEHPKRKPKEKPKGQRKLQASGEMARAQIVNFLDG